MININIEKTVFVIKVARKRLGGEILPSQLFHSDVVKEALSLAASSNVISGEINVDKWVINLGIIPAAQFDTLFIPRLAQAFAERLACEQASITGQQAIKMATSNATESSVLLDGKHLDGEGLIQLARSCLAPQTFKALLQDSPAYLLQQLLRRLLEGAWQSTKILPVCWYARVTADRLSIAAILYLLKSQRGHDWLMHQHAPTASQVSDWVKAIDQGEVPPEQVAELLTGNRPSDSIVLGQPAWPALFVMRWLLPLWRQPAVRQVIHRLKGGRGVQHLDAYLSCCLQCKDDVIQEEKGMQSVPAQVVPPRDNSMLPECEGIPPTARDAMQPGKGGLRSPSESRSSSLGISNAGLLLLWPLLPQLFSQLGLWEEEQFVSDAVRWQAVYGLDRLVWGDVSPTDGRLTLNQVLCGVSCSTSVPPSMPLSLLQLQQIDDWLAAIGQQLPGWQKLSLTDIRQLFLQRAGGISTEGAVPQISVRPEPYDFLLRDWPWPMTLASFPWSEQPLTIVWPLNGFTG
ncbi:hypothetical protein I5Q96_23490 [Serratia marcescens]|nr:hypothetical protein [Serratia marcescens]MBH3043965.1 hypothetical protein [Serratia marcescens]